MNASFHWYKVSHSWSFFFEVPGEDEQRPVKLRIQTKGAVGGTRENKHPKKHPRGQHPPKYTITTYNRFFHENDHCKIDIPHHSSSLLTPNDTPLKNKLIVLNTKAKQQSKSSYPRRSISFHHLSTSDPPNTRLTALGNNQARESVA